MRESGEIVKDGTTARSVENPSTKEVCTDLLTISEVCSRIPGARGNARVNPSTVTRWILNGCPSRGGHRIKLAAIRVGARWMVSPAALGAFFDSLTSSGTNCEVSPLEVRREQTRRRAASEQAERDLERRGA